MDVILASSSPRRRELLKLIFDDFSVVPADIDETIDNNIEADSAPEYLAVKKAAFIAKSHRSSLVIGSDTSVILRGRIFGKPKDRTDAFDMLNSLSGKTHRVITGCCLCAEGEQKSFSVSTEVEFYPLTKAEIEQYISTNEPFDKAGAYGIQGYGSLLIKGIKGDYFNVVGLPVATLKRQIEEFTKIHSFSLHL